MQTDGYTNLQNRLQYLCEFLPHTYKRNDIPLKEQNLTFINDFEFFSAH